MCEANEVHTVAHALMCEKAWDHPAVQEALEDLRTLSPQLQLGRTGSERLINSALQLSELVDFFKQRGSVPPKALLGGWGKGTVPLRFEYIYARLRASEPAWSKWVKGLVAITRAL